MKFVAAAEKSQDSYEEDGRLGNDNSDHYNSIYNDINTNIDYANNSNNVHSSLVCAVGVRTAKTLKIHPRGVQWKQGVVICMMLYTSLLHNTTPIHCTPIRLHPPCNEYPDSAG